MSSGAVHACENLWLAGTGATVLLYYDYPWPIAAAFGLGCLAGILISPDLDQDNVTGSEQIVLNRSMVLGMIWLAFWWPYARLMPHRSPASHWPIIGTALRLAYMTALGIPILWALHRFGLPVLTGLEAARIYLPLMAWGALGLAVADTVHFLRDEVTIRWNRRAGRNRRHWWSREGKPVYPRQRRRSERYEEE